jgi:glycosyltransferase involved in cell wall biosynthesis
VANGIAYPFCSQQIRESGMKLAVITTDNREHTRDYSAPAPYFGTAPEALLQGFAGLPDLEVHVVTCTQRPMKSPEKLADNIWFHSIYVPKIGWLRTSYQGCIRSTRRRLKVIKPDIVHGQGTERDCSISAVYSRFPNVVTIHGNMAELARLFSPSMVSYGWLTAQLENITLKRTSGVFCNSEYTENLVKGRTPKTWRVPNPLRLQFLDTPRPGPAPGKCILLNIGVVSERKRQVELLGAARRLHEQGLDFEMQFIGATNEDTPYGALFQERLKDAQARGYARHIGLKSTAELIASFDQAHGLIHFPSEEAFGLVVAEALARDLKFFGARLGGIVDIASGVPGVELSAQEDWEGLTAGIANWMRAGHPKSTGAPAIMAARYHPRVIAQRHLEIYREVLGGNLPKPS